MKMSQIDTENEKKSQNFPNLKNLMHIFLHSFDILRGLGMCRPVGLEKRKMQFFKRKLSGIDIGKDKISETFQFSQFLFSFGQNIDRFRGLEC